MKVVGPFPETAGEAFSQLYTPEQVKAFEEAVLARPTPITMVERMLFDPASIPPGHFAMAELEDDAQPRGAVVLKDKDGNVAAVVPRAAFEAWLLAIEAPVESLPNRHQRRAEAARKRRARP